MGRLDVATRVVRGVEYSLQQAVSEIAEDHLLEVGEHLQRASEGIAQLDASSARDELIAYRELVRQCAVVRQTARLALNKLHRDAGAEGTACTQCARPWSEHVHVHLVGPRCPDGAAAPICTKCKRPFTEHSTEGGANGQPHTWLCPKEGGST